ncbi:hypothetical protein GMAR_ORF255 [Golden Marseillevirus]|uniref:hypothetical protein n=1 Tax=Golden Marseillevirus TaxID=1720526 RepID=UPI000877A9F7|nr:hypothetical protein GMAR_ORF255 [Golden Marseillevirus]ALX27629.1 hypothetical protein GMAR_ORF255 [Golden Marseillevirus]
MRKRKMQVTIKTADQRTLLSKSPYFEALLKKEWQRDDAKEEFQIDIDLDTFSRIFKFANGETDRLPKAYKAAFSFYFPGFPFFRTRQNMELTEENVESLFTLFSHRSTRTFRQGETYCQEGIHGDRGYYLVVKPKFFDQSFKKIFLSLEKFTVSARITKRFELFFYDNIEVSAFWLWCFLAVEKQTRFVKDMLRETGLLVIPLNWLDEVYDSKNKNTFAIKSPENSILYSFKRPEGNEESSNFGCNSVFLQCTKEDPGSAAERTLSYSVGIKEKDGFLFVHRKTGLTHFVNRTSHFSKT